MKKATVILTAIVLAGCTCIGQIPSQTLYIDQNCQLELPDYRNQVTTSDNCPGVILQQTPEPGIILDATQPSVGVTITATDSWGNATTVEFQVIAIDTIFPTILPDSTLLTHTVEDIGKLIRSAHQATERYVINTYEYVTPDTIRDLFASLPTLYDDYGMVIFCPPAGEGSYFATYWKGATAACPCDTTEAAEFVSINLPL